MPTDLHSTLFFIARLLMGGAFVVFGVRNIRNIPALTAGIGARGVPQPRLAAIIGVTLQIVGGLLTAIGPWPVLGGLALIVFVVLATVLFHNFWDYSGDARKPHDTAAIMNTGWTGAFLLLIAVSF